MHFYAWKLKFFIIRCIFPKKIVQSNTINQTYVTISHF